MQRVEEKLHEFHPRLGHRGCRLEYFISGNHSKCGRAYIRRCRRVAQEGIKVFRSHDSTLRGRARMANFSKARSAPAWRGSLRGNEEKVRIRIHGRNMIALPPRRVSGCRDCAGGPSFFLVRPSKECTQTHHSAFPAKTSTSSCQDYMSRASQARSVCRARSRGRGQLVKMQPRGAARAGRISGWDCGGSGGAFVVGRILPPDWNELCLLFAVRVLTAAWRCRSRAEIA